MKNNYRIWMYILIAGAFAVIFIYGCKKEDKIITPLYTPGPTVADIDGNLYHSVNIGTQTWMVENLKTTRYRNGDSIPTVIENNLWAKLTTGAYCNYNNDSLFGNIYGLLYNWFAVKDIRNMAPIGWHIASDYEWIKLYTFLGGRNIAGGLIKEADTIHWTNPNYKATNETGFTALPAGVRDYYGFKYIGYSTYWWSTTGNFEGRCGPNPCGSFWGASYNSSYLSQGGTISMFEGYSVRCLKD